MKKAFLISLSVFLFLSIIGISKSLYHEWYYENQFSYAWNLSDKSSTIPAKAKYINEFLTNIESNSYKFAPHNAIFLKTRDNKFSDNIESLRTLRDRLFEIQTMDSMSFEYQTAIQQITQQEQGEAYKMLDTIKGCYMLENNLLCWGWIGALLLGSCIVSLFSAFIIFMLWLG